MPIETNGHLANRGLTSLVKDTTGSHLDKLSPSFHLHISFVEVRYIIMIYSGCAIEEIKWGYLVIIVGTSI